MSLRSDSDRVIDKISVLLVDDHAVVRRGFRRLLEDDPAILVVGEASDGESAVELANLLHPHVVVMDCAMPGAGGLLAAKHIIDRQPGIAILMLSMHSDKAMVRQALDAGARGYIRKNALDFDLADAVKGVAAGKLVLDEELADIASSGRSDAHRLSARQVEVLQLICDGRSSREIAMALDISVHTVGVHRTHIMKALGVHGVGALVTYALQHRLVVAPEAR